MDRTIFKEWLCFIAKQTDGETGQFISRNIVRLPRRNNDRMKAVEKGGLLLWLPNGSSRNKSLSGGNSGHER
ncbi:hypothetical protein ETC05_08200 [Geobacillus sp. BMUD]|uniref:hypothetical protein n=1 Tax=Geobacillus sp. BMUD TaxID=2508876 RepID=UPI00149202FC|nr:hypothetical protein [Geobacillus sp. BMUD]NNU83833.1 hypothetical protein [Geobacillus sp. BMUD]